MRRFFGRRDLLAALFLAALTILIYYPLTIQGRVLSSFDSLVYFYPNATYLAERLRAGQIPLWDPYLFAGAPFLANSQAGVLYPPNLLYLVGPVSRIYAVLVVVHVWWLAVGTYALSRTSLGVGRMASTFAATAVAFGGFVGGMNGHLNQLEALSWAPLAILLVERGAVERRWRLEVLAALPFALSALAGHSQELYMTGVVAGLAGFSRIVQGWLRDRRTLPSGPTGKPDGTADRPFRLGVGVGRMLADLVLISVGPALGMAIAAAQLIPTLELTRLSIRSTGLDFADAASFSLPPPYIPTTLLPTIGQSPPSTEWLGYVGLVTVAVAIVGVWRRPTPESCWLAGLALLGVSMALGKYTPLFQLAFDAVPGVDLFRVPARWLTLWTFGVALLAGHGFDALIGCGSSAAKRKELAVEVRLRGGSGHFRQGYGEAASESRGQSPGSNTAVRSLAFAGALFVVGAVGFEAFTHRHVISWPSPSSATLWCGSLVACFAFWRIARVSTTLAALGLMALLSVELGVASLGLPYQNAILLDGVETYRLSVDHILAQRRPDRVLAIGENSFDPGDLSDLRQMLAGTLSTDAIAEYVTAVKHVEGLTPNLTLRFGIRTIDGYDGGVLPLKRFDDLKQLFPVEGPTVSDGRLRLQLKSVPSPALLGWLNVRYVLINRLRDQWIGGAYYDLSVSQPVQPGEPLTLPTSAPFPTTTVGVIFRGADGAAPVGTLTIDAAGQTVSIFVGTGRLAGQHVDSDLDPDGVWLWTANLAAPANVSEVTTTWLGRSPIDLRSLTLIDRRTGTSQSVVVSPDYRLDFLGDVKIYENRDVLPRAFLTDGLDVAVNPRAVTAELESRGWNPRAYAVASALEVSPTAAFRASGDPGAATIVRDEPERVVVQTSATGPRVLVLTDSFYPGWRVTVDGTPRPILPVNILFRGVALGPGAHRVVFSYQPISWLVGVVVSAVGLATTLASLLLIRR